MKKLCYKGIVVAGTIMALATNAEAEPVCSDLELARLNNNKVSKDKRIVDDYIIEHQSQIDSAMIGGSKIAARIMAFDLLDASQRSVDLAATMAVLNARINQLEELCASESIIMDRDWRR